MTTMPKLAIETRRLQSDIDSLTTHLNGMHQTGEQMMAGINGLSSMWEGEAKNAFTEQFRSDYETLQSMADVIGDLIKSLEYARERMINVKAMLLLLLTQSGYKDAIAQ